MRYLLDTNVVSEGMRPRPDSRITDWLDSVDEDQIFLSVVTLAELRLGVERMPRGGRRDRLEAWIVNELPLRFVGRMLTVDDLAADAWGRIFTRRLDMGRPISAMDAFLAALATTHGLTLATRNIRDFSGLQLPLFNPWADT